MLTCNRTVLATLYKGTYLHTSEDEYLALEPGYTIGPGKWWVEIEGGPMYFRIRRAVTAEPEGENNA